MAFLTGSRVYGTPKPRSDVDLVVKVTPQELEILRAFAGGGQTSSYGDSASLRFGHLNLIVCTQGDEYCDWKRGTEQLRGLAPVTRAAAKAVFLHLQAIRERRRERRRESARVMVASYVGSQEDEPF